MSYKMTGLNIDQQQEKVVAKVEVNALDLRGNKQEILTIFLELTNEEQDAKPIIERVLKGLGYSYLGINDIDTTSPVFDAEVEYIAGKRKEQKDLERK